jgi:hypothetical protein
VLMRKIPRLTGDTCASPGKLRCRRAKFTG